LYLYLQKPSLIKPMSQTDKDFENIDQTIENINLDVDAEDSAEGDSSIPKAPSQKKAEDFEDKYIRLYSEFDNFKRRTAKERIEFMKMAGEDLIKKMLPILDDFTRSMEAEQSIEKSPFEEGIHLIFNKLKNILEAAGLQEMDKNATFNSDAHEAIAKIPVSDPAAKGKIIDTVEKGYLFNGKIIRHAKVVIGE